MYFSPTPVPHAGHSNCARAPDRFVGGDASFRFVTTRNETPEGSTLCASHASFSGCNDNALLPCSGISIEHAGFGQGTLCAQSHAIAWHSSTGGYRCLTRCQTSALISFDRARRSATNEARLSPDKVCPELAMRGRLTLLPGTSSVMNSEISAGTGLRSHPNVFKPRRCASISVEPPPTNGSTTTISSGSTPLSRSNCAAWTSSA